MSLQPPVWLGWSQLVPLGLGFSGELVCFLKNSCRKHVGKCLRISVMAKKERTLLPAACWWLGSLGRDLGAGRLMFDWEPRVFPLGIFILCTWQ